MKNQTKVIALVAGLLTLLCFNLSAADEKLTYEQVKTKLQTSLGMQIASIGDAPVPGLLQIMTAKGLFYVSENASYLLQARIYNLDEGMRNETEEALGGMRLGGLQQFQNAVIEYKADNEKYVVNIFTDITCGYCRKLHNEMDKYNDLGITVRYLAFPRNGLNSKSYSDMVSVWCADDKQQAMDNAKAGDTVPSKTCSSKVAEQYAFGQSIGVNGTPNIIMPDGSVIPGYQPPAQLEMALKAIL
ncbi:bifunctional protein-disulfide isomerase/oxidoreductase DsbC [uncultured Paraglaciecola sp.]|uniref:bifunctional protein-disulfide isomerase/oxidoreductase DsbC n=1 Tax=uncultured Paraglaciecola sp. TaxID=1765024 RepID=UPI0025D01F61|nr:bifunctional protein-disulfide isomerase/oxidoreductase DsbC [uncultured Paraglaciecola sp.]